uniref:Uncharacterized protein n=1 Tax=Hanusia phi TaxID=3032 RepID=A0A7S0ETL8_9CRYP
MAAFMQPAGQPGGAPTSMPTMNGQGQAPMMPAAAGMGMGPGAAGGNMFARQTRSGARSRYVDTLNPNAAASQSPTGNMMAAGAPGNMIAANKDAAKPKYKIFVPNQNASNAPDQ